MDIISWGQLAVICLLGAMSPGPSLALVIGNTIAGGRIYGIATSLGHAAGIGWWAVLTAVGITEVLVEQSSTLLGLQILGACLLGYIGFRTMMSGESLPVQRKELLVIRPVILLKGAGEGFLISLLNPKIALFFLAIFSHFVHFDGSLLETGLMGIIAAVIDASWYVSVALVITITTITKVLRNRMLALHRVSGIILVIIALYLISAVFRGLV